jgi:hypothetical protein
MFFSRRPPLLISYNFVNIVLNMKLVYYKLHDKDNVSLNPSISTTFHLKYDGNNIIRRNGIQKCGLNFNSAIMVCTKTCTDQSEFYPTSMISPVDKCDWFTPTRWARFSCLVGRCAVQTEWACLRSNRIDRVGHHTTIFTHQRERSAWSSDVIQKVGAFSAATW